MNISVDALNLNFLSLSLYANNVRQQLISSQYDSSTYRFTIKPVMFLKPNITYRLEFNYTGLINDYRDGGLFYTRWRDNYFGYTNHYIVATFFAIGYGARSTFPCFDDPSFKANFSVTLISPTAFKALGNMPLESESEIE
uniref:Aminopeptidase N-like N-terminal domain-containing protein n=1 Tax=Acrobeloides nanus TaxID=290746 RepID=A0A914EHZ6_9BILA